MLEQGPIPCFIGGPLNGNIVPEMPFDCTFATGVSFLSGNEKYERREDGNYYWLERADTSCESSQPLFAPAEATAEATDDKVLQDREQQAPEQRGGKLHIGRLIELPLFATEMLSPFCTSPEQPEAELERKETWRDRAPML